MWCALQFAKSGRQVGRMRVLTLGGGAGSEVIGWQLFVEWLEVHHNSLIGRNNHFSSIGATDFSSEAVVVDRYSEWSESARDMLELKKERRSSVVPGTDIKYALFLCTHYL